MREDLLADIVVIGGGPAGSSCATMLARQGWKVILLERERFPRDHVGESLLPASIPILEELGVLPAVEAQGFVKKLGATMVWGRDKEPWSWFFGETNRRYPHSYQVWRARPSTIFCWITPPPTELMCARAGAPPELSLTTILLSLAIGGTPTPSPVTPAKAGVHNPPAPNSFQ